jgi:ribosomal protein S18 acetylase RimI-like enzyme
MASPHLLDNVIWSALTSRQSGFAIGDDFARRFPVDIAPFGGMVDASEKSFESLARVCAPDDTVSLLSLNVISVPKQFDIVRAAPLNQMVGPSKQGAVAVTRVERLTVEDVDEIMALIALTKPGPFAMNTVRLGVYLGIRVGGVLVAMVGERFRLDGYTEVSAVCVHPTFRGQGLSATLVGALCEQIIARGDTPILHVFEDNVAASSLYEKLGFRVRTTFQRIVLKRI